MKKGIHPKYGPAVIKCACGNEVRTQSTVSQMDIEICSACHPFYTGKKKIVDSTGRVDRFMKRYQRSKSMQTESKKKESKKDNSKKKKTQKTTKTTKTIETTKKDSSKKTIDNPQKTAQGKK